MYSTKMSFKSLIVVFTLVVYSIGQASALNCYICSSDSDGQCYKQPKQNQYRANCVNWQGVPELVNHLFSGVGSAAQNSINDYTRSHQVNSNDNHCVTITGEVNSKDQVVRICAPKQMDCNAWRAILPTRYPGLRMKNCDTCESELCNSSSHLSVGLLSLIGSLLAIFWLRN